MGGAAARLVKTGIPWRDRPERFGSWKSNYNRFRNRAVKGVWAQVFRELQSIRCTKTVSQPSSPDGSSRA
jgi:transposase